MKLFLSSQGLPETAHEFLEKLLGQKLSDARIVYIANAKDCNPKLPARYKSTRDELAGIFQSITDLDLREYIGRPDELENALSSTDIIWVGGGNTFYLRYIMKKSGFDKIIGTVLKKGVAYAGHSAGAIVAGPTLANFEESDEPKKAPELVLDGLNLTNMVVLPHWGSEEYAQAMKNILAKFDQTDHKTARLRDDQAIIIDGNKQGIV